MISSFSRRKTDLCHFSENSFLGMNTDLEMLGNERIHPVIYHQNGAVGRIEYSQVKHGSQEVLMCTKFFHPLFKLPCPLVPVLLTIVLSVKQEGELVIAVMPVPENAHQVNVKFVEV